MPRKQSDKIITHRIEMSPKERLLVESIISTQKENQRLDAITSTLNAAGVAIGGSGAHNAGLLAAQILSIHDLELRGSLQQRRDRIRDEVLESQLP